MRSQSLPSARNAQQWAGRKASAEIEATTKPGSGQPPLESTVDEGVFAPSERDRIVQAMIECCAERGYRETSVEEVLARADVRMETFDAHFRDKEDCALAAIRKIGSETMNAVSIPESSGGSELARKVAGARAILELMAARPSYGSFGYIQARQGGTEQMHESYETSARVVMVMIEGLQTLAPTGTSLPPGTSRALLGGAEALLRREVLAGRAERLPALLPDLAYHVLVAFVGREQALAQAALIAEMLEAEGD